MIKAYAAHKPHSPLSVIEYDPGPLGRQEVEIDVDYCGICHSDLSMINNEWGMSAYPLVAGHEVVGRIAAVGADVSHLKPGQVVGLVLLAGLLMRIVLKPLRRLALAADGIGHGREDHVPEQGPSEVVTVIRAFNRMQERIHQLIENRTQALAAVGHDFRTPLARLKLRAEAVPDAEARQAIETDVAEMEAMVGSLLAYLSGEGDPEPKVRADLAVLCATLIDDAADRGLDARYFGPVHLEMEVRPLALKRALSNLIENALHHGTSVQLLLTRVDDMVTISVEDDGPGLPEDMLEEVKKPFVRLDTARPRDTVGFGLGLAIVKRAVEQEGGRFDLRNRAEGGLAAEIMLPMAPVSTNAR